MANDVVTFSYTRLSSLEKCPRQYKLHYLDKRPESFQSIEAFVGQIVHLSLAWLYEQRKEGTVPELGAVLEHFDAAWAKGLTPRIRVIRKNDSEEARHEDGRELLTRYYEGPLQRDKLETISLETSHTVALPNGHKYRGIFDRLSSDDRGRLHIIDYKTSKRVPKALDDALAFQLRSYAFLYLKEVEIHEVRLWYHYLRTSKTMGEAVNVAMALEMERTLVARIDAAMATTEFPPNPSTLCTWCGYRDICDASGYGPGPDGGPPVCPRCGKALREKRGRYGTFLSCEGYPKCRFTRDP